MSSLESLAIHAASRVEAWQLEDIGKKHLIPFIEKEAQKWFDTKPKKLISAKDTPLGKVQAYWIKGSPSSILCAVVSNKVIGALDVYMNGRNGPRVDNSGLLLEWQGKELGLWMYEIALQYLGKLCSSSMLSKGSIKTWYKLATKHKGRLAIPVPSTNDSNPGWDYMILPIVGWKVVGGIPYPVVPCKDGVNRDLFTLRKDAEPRDRGFNEYHDAVLAVDNSYYIIQK